MVTKAAEAVHSLADCGNQGLLLLGMKSAKKPPSPEHPLGHGKAVYFWSFLVALMLFSVGGASATGREANLDRHWRNARTIASHNPAMYKARAIGDLLINEQRLPANGFF